MSIWCSGPTIGWDDWPDEYPQPQGGQVRSYANGWSNHYPTTDGAVEREAAIDTATIPVWCVPGHSEEFDETLGPWLRLGVSSWEHNWHKPADVIGEEHADIVMDEDAVRALVASLTEWLEQPKAYPIEETAS